MSQALNQSVVGSDETILNALHIQLTFSQKIRDQIENVFFNISNERSSFCWL